MASPLAVVGRGSPPSRPSLLGRIGRARIGVGSAGFTLLETMMVVALVMVVSGIAIPVSRNMIARSKATSATMEMLTWFETARNRATAERRNFEVTFIRPSGRSRSQARRVERLENPHLWYASCPRTVAFVQFSGVADTPDQFGAASAIDFDGPTPYMFTSEGMFVDGNGDPSNGTLFMGKPGQPDTGAALTVFGSDRTAPCVEARRKTVAQMSTDTRLSPGVRPSEAGFSLIEVLIAMLVLTGGVLSLLGVIALGVQTVAASSPMLIAREKAREAVESVHAARDTGELAWSRIHNVANGGVFLAGMQDLRLPGADGLVNTADDAFNRSKSGTRAPTASSTTATTSSPAWTAPVPAGDRHHDAQSGRHDHSQSEPEAHHGQRPIPRPRRLAHLHAVHLHLQLFMIMMASTRHRAGDRGFSLIELLIAMGLTMAIMAVTMTGLSDAMSANDMVVNVTTMNNGLRLAMDLMVRDLLQTGSGLGKGHVIQIPSGGSLIKRPGPPGLGLHTAGDRARHSGGDSRGRPRSDDQRGRDASRSRRPRRARCAPRARTGAPRRTSRPRRRSPGSRAARACARTPPARGGRRW